MSRPSRATFALSALSALGRRIEPPAIAWLMRRALEDPEIVSLAAGFTDNPTLPVREVRQLVDEILRSRRTGEPALQYGTTAGLPELRALTARRLLALDRAAAPPEAADAIDPARYAPDRVVITNGSQQLLYLLTETLCDPGDIVLVEAPTYFVYLGIAQGAGLECRGVRRDAEGVDPADLEAVLERLHRQGVLRRVKFLYLVTYHQNPTGTSTSLARKKAALEILRRWGKRAGHPIHLVEDAAYRELGFGGTETPTALAIPEAADRVVVAGTYTKPFATGLRIGFGLLPEPILSRVLHLKSNHDFGTANLLQAVMVRALSTGVYDRHLARLRRRYRTKAGWMLRALEAAFPDAVQWQPPTGGLYVWARAPRRIRTGPRSALFEHALAHKVLYVPGCYCYPREPRRRPPDHEMRLSFGNATRAQIETGIERLAAALREML